MLRAKLLHPVTGLSGRTYPKDTEVSVAGVGSSVDAFVAGDWLPLSWWEYAPLERERPEDAA